MPNTNNSITFDQLTGIFRDWVLTLPKNIDNLDSVPATFKPGYSRVIECPGGDFNGRDNHGPYRRPRLTYTATNSNIYAVPRNTIINHFNSYITNVKNQYSISDSPITTKTFYWVLSLVINFVSHMCVIVTNTLDEGTKVIMYKEGEYSTLAIPSTTGAGLTRSNPYYEEGSTDPVIDYKGDLLPEKSDGSIYTLNDPTVFNYSSKQDILNTLSDLEASLKLRCKAHIIKYSISFACSCCCSSSNSSSSSLFLVHTI